MRHREVFRLIGVVDGDPRTFVLREGACAAGSADTNEIVLPTLGVSRRHARFIVSGNSLLVEDVGSKNGTFVNGSRTARRLLHHGDEVALGPVLLRVERPGRPKTRLAVTLDPADGTPLPTETHPGPGGNDLNRSFQTIERLAALFAGRPGPMELALALHDVTERLGAVGAIVLLAGRGQRVILAAAGLVLVEIPLVFDRLFVPRGESGQRVEASDDDGGTGWLCAAEDLSTDATIAVLFSGVSGHRPERESILRLLLRMGREVACGGEAPVDPDDSALFAIPMDNLACRSPGMRAVYEAAVSVARSSAPVLLLGETGVGKEHVARTIHAWSRRAAEPFIPVNCAALPADLIEAELFGIETGVATGVGGRPGLFRQAGQGTILLDEVDELAPAQQSKLLRILEEQVVRPLGGTTHPLEARVIAATNSDLARSVREGRFRADLYYRIAGFVIPIPPLRERREDIGPLVAHFLARTAREERKRLRGVTFEALRALGRHDWPGNVRELANEVRRAVLLCPDGGAIDASHLDTAIGERAAERGPRTSAGGSRAQALAEVERNLIAEALARTRGNRSAAARDLGMSRNGLAARIRRFGISVARPKRINN